MKVAIDADAGHVSIIKELLSIWSISYTPSDISDVTIVYRRNPTPQSKKCLVIPSESSLFRQWSERQKLDVIQSAGAEVMVPAVSKTELRVCPSISFQFNNTVFENNDNIAILGLDIIDEYMRILNRTLGAKSSFKYRLFTLLPVGYTLAPRKLRDAIMSQGNGLDDYCIRDVLPLDALRFALANALQKLTKKKLAGRYNSCGKRICALTHDVETKDGLSKAVTIKRLEEKYDLPSAWYLPSAQYSLDKQAISTLANYGEIGSHDTKHDGKLFDLSARRLNERLLSSKKTLEKLAETSVVGFRAPLLQHSKAILRTLNRCNYTYDSSIPTWEIKHPRTMRSHGIGTVFPTNIEGIVEIPLSLMQDHQFLNISGLSPKELLHIWLSVMAEIKELGGICVFLSHPEYSFLDTRDLSCYEELLNALSSDSEVSVMCPKDLTKF